MSREPMKTPAAKQSPSVLSAILPSFIFPPKPPRTNHQDADTPPARPNAAHSAWRPKTWPSQVHPPGLYPLSDGLQLQDLNQSTPRLLIGWTKGSLVHGDRSDPNPLRAVAIHGHGSDFVRSPSSRSHASEASTFPNHPQEPKRSKHPLSRWASFLVDPSSNQTFMKSKPNDQTEVAPSRRMRPILGLILAHATLSACCHSASGTGEKSFKLTTIYLET